jgi:hypothetical protein
MWFHIGSIVLLYSVCLVPIVLRGVHNEMHKVKITLLNLRSLISGVTPFGWLISDGSIIFHSRFDLHPLS